MPEYDRDIIINDRSDIRPVCPQGTYIFTANGQTADPKIGIKSTAIR